LRLNHRERLSLRRRACAAPAADQYLRRQIALARIRSPAITDARFE
jgi:hypothetical protein